MRLITIYYEIANGKLPLKTFSSAFLVTVIDALTVVFIDQNTYNAATMGLTYQKASFVAVLLSYITDESI